MSMQQLCQILEGTLSPDTATVRQAEDALKAARNNPAFANAVVEIMGHTSVPRHIQQCAAVSFKNYIKNGWDPEGSADGRHPPVPNEARILVKKHIVDLMCRASAGVMPQIAEALRIISTYDYPDQWLELLPSLVKKLTQALGYSRKCSF